MMTYTVTLWTTAGHMVRTIVYTKVGEDPEKRARLLRSEYVFQPDRVRIEER